MLRYGGIYLDTDIVVLKPLSSLNNTVGLEDELGGNNLNGAVMAFRKHRYCINLLFACQVFIYILYIYSLS